MGFKQWCIPKNGGGYTQRGVTKGLKIPCLFMITEVSIRCQKNPEVGIRRIPPNTPLALKSKETVRNFTRDWRAIIDVEICNRTITKLCCRFSLGFPSGVLWVFVLCVLLDITLVIQSFTAYFFSDAHMWDPW